MRQFWRVAIDGDDAAAPATAVAVDLGPDDLPLYARALNLYREPLDEPPFLNVHRFLESIGAPVPALYFAAPGERLLLVEDVGDRSLFQAGTEQPERAAALYRAAVDELLRLHVEGTARRDARCVAFGVSYDERLFRWELEQFIEVGLEQIANGADPELLKPELGDLAARLGRLPRVFSHRDYHGNNLFVQSGRGGAIKIRIIDFQDALMAPATQDLAVLMTTRDTARVISPEIESRLLDYYLAGLARRQAPSPARAEFVEGYRLCVIQHAIKMIGRFVWLEQHGKEGYTSYLPDLVAQARRMLARARDFPRLKDALGVAR
jgi:N-acetylmuramate 1-kinase